MTSILDVLSPVRDYIYAGLAVAAVAGWFYHDHVIATRAVEHEMVAVKAASDKAEQDAVARITALNNQHIDELAKVKEIYDKAMVDAAHQRDADLQRLRDADAYRRAHPVLDSPAGPGASAPAGSSSLTELEQISAGLADALRRDDAEAIKCFADRDALTGK